MPCPPMACAKWFLTVMSAYSGPSVDCKESSRGHKNSSSLVVLDWWYQLSSSTVTNHLCDVPIIYDVCTSLPLITGNAVHGSRRFPPVCIAIFLSFAGDEYGQVCIEPSSCFCAVPRLLTTSCYSLSYLLLRHLRKRYRERTFWAGIRRGKPTSQYM